MKKMNKYIYKVLLKLIGYIIIKHKYNYQLTDVQIQQKIKIVLQMKKLLNGYMTSNFFPVHLKNNLILNKLMKMKFSQNN